VEVRGEEGQKAMLAQSMGMPATKLHEVIVALCSGFAGYGRKQAAA